MSVNKVFLIGNVGDDPDVRYLSSGDAVANFSLATTDRWKDKNTGENKDATEWHKIVIFGKLGEVVKQYVRKGSQLYLEGKLRTRKYQDKSGQDKYTTEIHCDQMQMLGKKNDNSAGGYQNTNSQPINPQVNKKGVDTSNMDDDIPF